MRRAATLTIAISFFLLGLLGSAQAQSITDFEGFIAGQSVDGQGGWKATNPNWDEEIVDLGGNKVWRVSNEVTSGSFGDQPFAPGSNQYAGESTSTHLFSGSAAVTSRFIASFDFWSVTGASQDGLDVTISPDDGQGSRQSFLSIEDNGAGIDIDFFDTDGNHPVSNQNGGFRFTQIATGLSYDEVHNIVFDITFVDGNIIDLDGTVHGNDIVKIFVDGALVHTGTTWESYFWTTIEGQTPPSIRAIDTLLFRLSTPSIPSQLGGGYYFDNVTINAPVSAPNAPDHLQCYDVEHATKLDPKPIVDLEDQFAVRENVKVKKKADLYCTPVDKNGEGIVNADNNLTCYKIKKYKPNRKVTVENQFGEQSFKLKHSELLCVPSVQTDVQETDKKDDD